MTRKEVKRDLHEIRYYLRRKSEIDYASRPVGTHDLEKLLYYNELMRKAPIRLYEVYLTVYIHGMTFEEASESLCLSVTYVFCLQKALIDYLVKATNRQTSADLSADTATLERSTDSK